MDYSCGSFFLEDGSEVIDFPINYTGLISDGFANKVMGIENRLTYFKSRLHCTKSFASDLRNIKSGISLKTYYLLNIAINNESTIIFLVD